VTDQGLDAAQPVAGGGHHPAVVLLETGFEDVSQFWQTDGLRVGTFSYNIASNAILTGSFGLMGREIKRQGVTKLGDAPYTVLEHDLDPGGERDRERRRDQDERRPAVHRHQDDLDHRQQQPARPERRGPQVPGRHRRGPHGSHRSA
jgi:hypothetical protein